MSTAHRYLKSPGDYLVHPPTHKSQYHGHEWMTHIPFIPCQQAVLEIPTGPPFRG